MSAPKQARPRRAKPPLLTISSGAAAAISGEWLRRVQAEYQSAAVTGQLAHWLIQLAAPPALIRQALRIVADELRHAELSDLVCRAAGGSGGAALRREQLELPRGGTSLEADVTQVVVQSFCLGETAAVRLFHRMRESCSVPVARRALDRVLRDEVRHRDFGWSALQWLLDLPDAEARRAAITAALPDLIAQQRALYAPGVPNESAAKDDFPGPLRSWGLIPPHEYRRALDRCTERDLRPRFARLSIPLVAPGQ